MTNSSICASSHPGIDSNVKLGKGIKIAPDAFIGKGSEIGDNVTIEPGVVIYENVKIGSNTYVGAQCILGERVSGFTTDPNYKNPELVIGDNSTLRSGTIIYAGCTMGEKFQTGHRACIREYSHFGKNCAFGTMSQSDGQIKVGDNCRFHNNVFIATFTTIEDDVHFYPMSCTTDSLHPPCQKGREGPYVEKGAIICARVLLLPRVRIGQGAVVAGGSVVNHDVPANMIAAGNPAKVVKAKDAVRCHLEDRPAWDVALESAK